MAQQDIILKLKGVADFSDIQSNVSTLQKYFKQLELPDNITKKLKKSFDTLDKELQTFQTHLNSGFKTKGDVTGLEKSGQKIVTLFQGIEDVIGGIDTDKLKNAFQVDTSKLDAAKKDVKELKGQIKEKFNVNVKVNGKKDLQSFDALLEELYKTSKTKKLEVLKGAIDSGDIVQIKAAIAELEKYGNTLSKADALTGKVAGNSDKFNTALANVNLAISKIDTAEFSELTHKLDLSEQQVQELTDEIQNNLNAAIAKLIPTINASVNASKDLFNGLNNDAQGALQLNNELSQMKSQVTHFFSLVNAAQLLRRALQDVFNTVKELDAVMTETAVVTDFSVGDMWDKLPEYTEQAKALGVATKDLYAATTLYYQQGLDSNASMAAGIETMKMARIAGMEAAEATDAMTAALRGFNMEVNETNAQKVNDVYSELAAITASDTEEIATAMSKTASIASAVGAEFENIAVFLAQGIETTRESADSIGTALKTVLARFNELTKDPAEIQEVDGEIVDANKVDAALKSVGISLLDVNNQFRDADEVLLEVAQKWNTMSVMQQRYIATQAAGSRQQSRFIAMMSDYNRTLELQSAAYSAEGAAQAQYEKTLESLESKLARLKDTWDEFILGIANSDVIKAGVDALSELLDIINKMTNAPGILGGVLKALLAFEVFQGGKALFSEGGFFDRFLSAKEAAKKAAEAGKSASEAFREAFNRKKTTLTTEETQSSTKGSFYQGGIVDFSKEASQNSKAVTKATESLKEYDKAIKTAEKASDAYIDALWQGNEIEEERAKITLELAEANKKKAKEEMDAAWQNIAVQDLNKEQLETMHQLVLQDIGLTNAKVIASSDAASQYIQEAIAKDQLNDETRESIELTALEIAGKEAAEKQSKKNTIQNWAEKTGGSLDNVSDKVKSFTERLDNFNKNTGGKGIKQLGSFLKGEFKGALGQTGKSLLNTGKSFVKLGSNGLKAGKTIIAAMGSAAPIVAGLTAAVIAGVAAWKIYDKYFSLEARMKAAEASLELATSAASKAQQAFSDMNDTISSLKDNADSIDELTKGTVDFKVAVAEANQQMLELISLYPELREEGRTFTDENGVIRLSEAGEEYLKDLKLQSLQFSNAAVASASVAKNQLDKEAAGEDFEKKVKDKWHQDIGGGEGVPKWEQTASRIINGIFTLGISEVAAKVEADETQDKLVSKIQNDGYDSTKLTELFANQKDAQGNYSQEFKDFANEIGLTTKELSELQDSAIDLAKTLEQEDNESKEQGKNLLKSHASDQLSNSDYSNRIIDIYANDSVDALDFSSKEVEKAQNELNSKTEKEDWAETLMEKGIIDDIEISGLSEEEMTKKIYEAVTGNEAGEMKLHDMEIELTKFKLANEADIGAEAMNTFYDNLQNASESNKAKIETILNSDIEITADQLNGLFDESGNIINTKLDELIQDYEEVYGDIDIVTSSLQLQQEASIASETSTTASSALSSLAEEGTISDETALIASLEKVEGLYDNLGTAADEWSVISKQGIVEQMNYLAQLSQQQYQQKQDSINAAKEERQATLDAITALEGITPEDGAAAYAYAQQRIDELKKTLDSTDWVLDIEVTDNFDDIMSSTQALVLSFDKITEAAELLGEGFTVSADDAQALSDTFPGILENATITAEGQIKLDKEVGESKLGTAEEQIKANGEAQKAVILQDKARLDAAITAKETELVVVEMALASESEAYQAQLLADLANQEGFANEIAQIEQDEVETNLNALEAKGINTATYGNYELEVDEDVAKKGAEIYQADVQQHAKAENAKAADLKGFLTGLADAAKKFITGDWEGAKTASKSAFATGAYTAEGPTPKEIEAAINNSDIKDKFDIVKNADGELDVTKTLKNYYSSGVAELEDMRVKSAQLGDQVAIIDAQINEAIYKLNNPGDDKGKNKDSKEKDKDFDYDEYFNQQKKLAKLQADRNTLEREYDKLLEAEIVDLKALEENQKKQVENLEQQLEIEEKMRDSRISRMNQLEQENSKFAKALWFDDELGTLQINEAEMEKIGNMSEEDIEAFNEYYDKMNEHNDEQLSGMENILELTSDIVNLTAAGTTQLKETFNLNEKLKRIQDDITNIQAKRNLLLDDTEANSEAILKTYAEEKDLLEDQLSTQQAINEERIAEHEQNLALAQSAGTMEFITDLGNGQFAVNQELFNQQNKDMQDSILKTVELLNESGDAVQESTEAVYDAEEAVIEFKNSLKDKAVDFFNQVKEALIESYQRQIDSLNEVNDAINDSNSEIINSIQESLSRQRQERDNAKTEQSIADKEQQLAYLQMDTSGANQLAIQELQKEITEDRESYTDQLIDQKISALEEQNSKAFEQRQAQIEIMQAQLEQMQNDGTINNKVQTIIDNGLKLDGTIGEGTQLAALFTSMPSYTGMTKQEQEDYWNDLKDQAVTYLTYLNEYSAVGQEGSDYKVGQDVTSELGGLPSGAKATVTNGGIQIEMSDGTQFTAHGVVEDLLGNLNFSQLTGQTGYFKASDARRALRAAVDLERLTEEEQYKYDIDGDGIITVDDARLILRNATQLESISFGADKFGETDFFNLITLIDSGEYKKIYDFTEDGELTDADLELLLKNFGMPKEWRAFATGGLADFTGPAWLDGTKGKPELVLNAQDTKNFIQLKDILSSVMKNVGSNKTDEKTGDIYYEIHIDVEKLTSDYDVDDVAKRVQQIITADANYRNVNLINRLR